MIFLGLIFGMTIYFLLKIWHFAGTVKQFFTEKATLIPAILSVLTTVSMAVAVDWTLIEKVFYVATVPVFYAYVVALIIGMGNSTLFFSLLKKKAPKADVANPPV